MSPDIAKKLQRFEVHRAEVALLIFLKFFYRIPILLIENASISIQTLVTFS